MKLETLRWLGRMVRDEIEGTSRVLARIRCKPRGWMSLFDATREHHNWDPTPPQMDMLGAMDLVPGIHYEPPVVLKIEARFEHDIEFVDQHDEPIVVFYEADA